MPGPLIFGLPSLLVKLAAALYGGHLALQGATAVGQYGLGKRQIAATVKGQKTQADVGRREEERMKELMNQLLSMQGEQTAENREFDLLRMLLGGAQQQQINTSSLIQAVGQRPARVGSSLPPASLMSLLR